VSGDHGYEGSASRGVPVYIPAFTGTHCTSPHSDGQAELTWVASYILRWFARLLMVTHPILTGSGPYTAVTFPAVRPMPNYTARRQRHMQVNNNSQE